MLQGPDVSSYQETADWRAVAQSGRSFGWCKATEGTDYVNPFFADNWADMAGKLVRGTYHFGLPDKNAPEAEVDHFLGIVGRLNPGDLLALDLEAGSGNLLQWALTFLENLESRVGFKPMLYSGSWFLDPHGVEGNDQLATYGLWLSGYTQFTPPLPPGWNTLAMWQFTDNDQIPGINGGVDESYFFGTVDQLRSYGMPDPSQPAQPALTAADIVVNDLSVIGDMTYPDGVNIDEQAPNQPVSRRIFIRQLVQHAKVQLGAK